MIFLKEGKPWLLWKAHHPEYTLYGGRGFRQRKRRNTELGRARDRLFNHKHPDYWRYLKIREPEYPRPQRPWPLCKLGWTGKQ